MARDKNDGETVSKGVNELIARLREDGVEAGRAEAATIVDQARAEAMALREAAQAEAQAMREAARKDADAFRKAGEDALQAAVRDATLDLKIQMTEKFRADMRRLVSREMKDATFLRQIILELVGRVRERVDHSGSVEMILPVEAIGLDELRDNVDELENGPLTEFVRGVAGELVRDGVRFAGSDELAAGARVYLENEDVMIDLSDVAVADMLARHLQPRFRAILEGVVK